MIAARSTIVAASTVKRVAQRSRFPGCLCMVHYVSALHAERPQQQQTVTRRAISAKHLLSVVPQRGTLM